MTYNQTPELREKLAKYGVEWDERNCPYYFFDTAWKYAKGAYASFTESSDGTTFLILKNVTPEQAIAATLGSELNPDGLPVGLTISEDGKLLNWRGENYVKQSTLGE